jgi:septal ring-binding cell division protein DamX
LQSGKVSFISGDFKSAFHQLLPLAAEGIPQAEYGVGYMYYYGYGVTQDSESGIFWMNKAATAHYAPAIRALAAIQEISLKQEKIPSPSTESTLIRNNNTHMENKIEKDPLLETLTTPPSPPEGHVLIMPQRNETTSPESKSQPFKKINTFISADKKYTLQLLGSYSLSFLQERQVQLNLKTSTSIGRTKHNGRDWYVLTYGAYPALANAELAKFDLPKKIKDFNPWIRKCDELIWVK